MAALKIALFFMSLVLCVSSAPTSPDCTSLNENPIKMDKIRGNKRGESESIEDCVSNCTAKPECLMVHYKAKKQKCKQFSLVAAEDIDLISCDSDDSCSLVSLDGDALVAGKAGKKVTLKKKNLEEGSDGEEKCRQKCIDRKKCVAYRIKEKRRKIRCHLIKLKEEGEFYQCPRGSFVDGI